MKKAISLGYWGIAGIDIVIGEDNRVLVIDLNFRQNKFDWGSSTKGKYNEII